MHSNFQMDISLPWIDAALTQHLKLYLNIFIFYPRSFFQPLTTELGHKTARCESIRALLHYVKWDRIVTLTGAQAD